MAGRAGDRKWLKDQLVKALGWDVFVAEGVVEAIAAAQSQEEVDGIVEGYMGGSKAAEALVRQFRGAAAAGGPAPPPPMPGMQAYRKGEGALRPPALPPAVEAAAAASATGRGPGAAAEPPAAPVAASADAAAQKLNLGVNVKTSVGKGRKGKGTAVGGAGACAGPGARLEHQVVNCLSCGKVYDCRAVTNDILAFLDSGGACTFCGAVVALRYADGTTNSHLAAAQAAGASTNGGAPSGPGGCGTGPSSSGTATGAGADTSGELAGFKPEMEQANAAGAVAYNASEEAARALRDQLVEYDRHSAKRTTVIDDQSDFFEIDTNAWLTDEERAQLRARQREAEAAEAARRNKVVVTIDLLGRRVLMADEEQEGGGAAGARAAAAAAAGEAAAAAAAATLEEAPQGGGAGAAAALGRARQALEDLRIRVNPSMESRFVFLPKPKPPPEQAQQRQAPPAPGGEQRGARRRRGAGGAGGAGGTPHARRGSKGVSRLQHDDPFAQLTTADSAFGEGIKVLADSEEARMALEAALDEAAQGPFDICPPSSAAVPRPAPARPAAGGAGTPAAGGAEVLQDGMVLLRSFLTLEQQAEVVRVVRDLGVGPGGFYQPSYSSGSTLSLHMMSLGKHWEPRTSSYEAPRSSHDGAAPPPIPARLTALAAAALAAAVAAPGAGRIPGMQPDVCLCNFYEKSGRLGLHQDKDEGRGSLRAGLPVVSLSMGDAADFAFGPSRDAARCRTLRLGSGDALVFGGAARMIFHGVTAVHGGTAPPELLERTDLRPGRLNLTFRQT
eukprot:scaffold3.g6420.t1